MIYVCCFNIIKDFEKTPQLIVGLNIVNSDAIKGLQFSLSQSITVGGAICDKKYEDVKPITINNDEVKDLKCLRRGSMIPY